MTVLAEEEASDHLTMLDRASQRRFSGSVWRLVFLSPLLYLPLTLAVVSVSHHEEWDVGRENHALGLVGLLALVASTVLVVLVLSPLHGWLARTRWRLGRLPADVLAAPELARVRAPLGTPELEAALVLAPSFDGTVEELVALVRALEADRGA